MLVMKFGGTSVGSAQRFRDVLNLLRETYQKERSILVVLSAMAGVTNALIEGAEKAVSRDLPAALAIAAGIKDKHEQVAAALFSNSDQMSAQELLSDISNYLAEIEILYKGISYLGELSARSLDAISGLGELVSSRILAALVAANELPVQWLDARQLITTDGNFGKANPLWEKLLPKCQTVMAPILRGGTIIITQGYIGTNENGASTTLGRGGSDFSASIFGVALNADEIQIWTDVDGMMTADPKVVKDACVLPTVSFQEASELAYFGAKVLHPSTIAPAVEKNIPVRILNTMAPQKKGTIIKDTTDETGSICAIASKKGVFAFFITASRMLMAYGYMMKLFEVFDKHRTSIDLVSTSEVSVSITTDRADTVEKIASDLKEYGEVKIMHDVAIVTVVGRQFRKKSGVAAEIFTALQNINILMISGGASDINLSFVVASDQADKVVRQLHNTFFTGATN